MILLDPTEARDNTRLPQAIINSSIQCAGLESATGADFIISPLKSPKLTSITSAPVHQRQLRQHTEPGILIQRKDGRDFLSSIPDLASIQERMTAWSGKIGPILVIIGQFERGKNARVRLDGKLTRNSWPAYSAAKMTWQARGGLIAELSTANELTAWANWLHDSFLSKISQDRLVIDRPPVQALVRSDNPWWSPLITLPHIGVDKAAALASWLGDDRQSLAHALAFLSDAANVKLAHPPGFGRKTFEDCRAALGLAPGERLRIELSIPPGQGQGFIVTWPPGSNPPIADGHRYITLPDGAIQAIYNRDELELAVGIMKGES
jgi:hypothetical protein